MTYYTIRWWLFLILLVVGGYYLLRFFGRLWNVNMFSVLAGTFKAGSRGWFAFAALPFYIIFIFGIFLFLETPMQIMQMKRYHAGGLLGYRDGWKSHVLDPSHEAYIPYQHQNPPSAAYSFQETFGIVLLYKSRPYSKNYSEYYQDTSLLRLTFFLQALLVIAVGFITLYFMLYVVAGQELPITGSNISRQASRFQQITGMPLLRAFLAGVIIYVMVLGTGVVYVKLLINHYRGRYETSQHSLKRMLMNRISPGMSITGTVIRRQFEEKSFKDISSAPSRSGRWKRVWLPAFTVEFRDLIRIPVYLNVNLSTSEGYEEEKVLLNGLFPDEREIVPARTPLLEFTVNPDYTITLKGEKIQTDQK